MMVNIKKNDQVEIMTTEITNLTLIINLESAQHLSYILSQWQRQKRIQKKDKGHVSFK